MQPRLEPIRAACGHKHRALIGAALFSQLALALSCSEGDAATRADAKVEDAARVDAESLDASRSHDADARASLGDGSTREDANALNPGSDGGDVDRDAGAHDGSAGGDVPTFVVVGYAGLRAVSYDLGVSWKHKQTLSEVAADDTNLLRGVTFAQGLFVAVGHKIFTSPTGETWSRREHPEDDSQWLGDVEYGNDRFVASGGYGYSAISLDGLSWDRGGDHATEAMRSLAFGDGVFMGRTDPGNWWRTTDGETWTLDSGGHTEDIAFCEGEFKNASSCAPIVGEGVYLRAGSWDSGHVQRSENGIDWTNVFVGYVGSITGIAFGYTAGDGEQADN
jgi:hypothetical protein